MLTKLTQEIEINIIEYYRIHSDYNTCKTFHIRKSRLLKILSKYNIEPHSKTDSIALGHNVLEQTLLDKYRVTNPSNIPEVRKKAKQTMIDRYGVTYTGQSKELMQKAKQTNLEKYGVDNVFQVEDIKEKIKQTNMSRYGVASAVQTDEVKNKMKKTTMERYGVEYFNQCSAAAAFHRKLYIYNNLYFDSFPEVCYYIYNLTNGIPINKATVSFKYYFNNIEHMYFPDFEVDGILVEIKGSQFVKEDGTWQNPYDHSLDQLFEAKHQCAIANNIQILYPVDYQKYIDWFYLKGYKKEDFIV